ncbi:MAG: YgjV family protein [Phyllobacteriaceae bacterium]|nr:YgjV family protein [Phyllobacteriaceae bacterium]
MDFFSPAQLVGYVAFVLGVAAFLQKSDVRLKFLNAAETLAYTVHFAMLGNFAASGSAFVSCGRSLLAMRLRSAWLAIFFVALNVAVGVVTTTTWTGWLPVVGSSLTTLAVFLLQGVPMRLTILVATLLWLANNILSGSIGGTVLEFLIALANLSTIARMTLRRAP